MNKKITSSALAALMVAGSTSFSAFAAMTNGTVVIGNKAFDINYVNDVKNVTEITNAILTGGTIYVKDFAGNWIDNVSGLKVDASKIPAVTYKSAAGVETKFDAADKDAVSTLTVASVTAVNLLEVEVKFSTSVDKATAQNKDNYTIASAKTIKTASLLEDGTTVRLTLDASVAGNYLANQKADKISIKGVKAGDKVLDVKDMVFTPVDSTIPTVVSVVPLGTKAVKVVFSEPIKTASIGSFKLDGKAFYGSPSVGDREVTLTPYDTTTLTVGEHTLTIVGAEDFSGLKSLNFEQKFTVVEDKVAPTMTEVSATLEKLTVTFSEDVDPNTVDVANVYWKSGDTKIKATAKTRVAGNKYDFEFIGVGKSLPSYETVVNVEGIKDYSGNVITETTKLVKATLDQTRPEVLQIKANADNKSFKITFNKKINVLSSYRDFVVVTDKDSKVRSINTASLVTEDGNAVIVTMYEALPQGTNTVKVSGIKDATTLQNTMLDYTQELTLGDTTAPKYASHSIAYSPTTGVRRVVVAFNEKMDAATLANPSNYVMTYNGVQRTLPSDATLSVVQDSKAILIDFPSRIDNEELLFGASGLTEVKVMGVKDIAGNVLDGFVYPVGISAIQTVNLKAYYKDTTATSAAGFKAAAITGLKTIKVSFDQGIAKASANDFTVVGSDVESVTTDNTNVVTLNLKNPLVNTGIKPVITIRGTDSTINTVAGQIGIGSQTALTINATGIIDELAPRVQLAASPAITEFVVSGTIAQQVITVGFTENLAGDAIVSSGVDQFYAQDFVVTRDSDGKILSPNTDYTTNLMADNSKVQITVSGNTAENGKYRVAVKSDAKYIQDTEAYDAVYALPQSNLFAVADLTLASAISAAAAEAVNVAKFTTATNAAAVGTLLDANEMTLTLTNYAGLDATGKTEVATALFTAKATLTTKTKIQDAVTPAIATAKTASDARAAAASAAASVSTVKGLVAAAPYSMTTILAIDEPAVKAAIEAKIATLAMDGVTATVTKVLYTPAVAGTTDGTYTFTVGLSKGAATATTATLTMTISK
ncbi:hypothetical protein G9F72_021595 [Clostridium estertheticum]|uniref:hypothetical protein n=1 Tax=Clostridium estertheticum TaxID=238834 RepID=UPI0013E964C4|nr:hypothetical protein [Clostridium estertheticum]MBZ9688916.1 hypothetical protein [Clostridium estertheticum]